MGLEYILTVKHRVEAKMKSWVNDEPQRRQVQNEIDGTGARIKKNTL
jgi:hypothetical protein